MAIKFIEALVTRFINPQEVDISTGAQNNLGVPTEQQIIPTGDFLESISLNSPHDKHLAAQQRERVAKLQNIRNARKNHTTNEELRSLLNDGYIPL